MGRRRQHFFSGGGFALVGSRVGIATRCSGSQGAEDGLRSRVGIGGAQSIADKLERPEVRIELGGTVDGEVGEGPIDLAVGSA